MNNQSATMNTKDNPLGYKKESTLLVGFAIPCIISMLVTALYNIVDQIFIGQGIGMLGNAATNIAFPLSTTCTAISLLLGIGSATNFRCILVPVKRTNLKICRQWYCAYGIVWNISVPCNHYILNTYA